MNDFESQYDSNCRPNPIRVKEPTVVPPAINRKHHRENNDLGKNIREKDREFAMKLAPEHRTRYGCLQSRVGQPEHVVSDLCARTHQGWYAALTRAKDADLLCSTSSTIAALLK